MNRIVWMADELFALSHPSHWKEITDKSQELFSRIGKEGFNHNVVTPVECIGQLSNTLINHKFSVVVDLTGGWLSGSLKDSFGNTPVWSDIHLSRVRDIASPDLPTSGHIVSLSPTQIHERKSMFDWSRPLIIDDVSFSGASSITMMRILGLEPTSVHHGFLILNVGDLGDELGGKNRLLSVGSQLHWGHELNTSEGDDGWHIKDIVDHTNLHDAFITATVLQELFTKNGHKTEMVQQVFALDSVRRRLFPHAVRTQDLRDLLQTGQFIPLRELQEGSIHTRNPILLASPYFLNHISHQKLIEQESAVHSILMDLHERTSHNEEREAILGLREIAKRSIEGKVCGPERG